MNNQEYQPEAYWTEVGAQIEQRADGNVIAGDDEPFYHYKRQRFLEMLDSLDFTDKKVLEVGSGPGGNLKHLSTKNIKSLHGADISSKMISLATNNLRGTKVELTKTNGTSLPFDDNQFDLVFTATVLQHNTDELMLEQLIAEICRVSNNEVVFFERVEASVKGDALCMGRPIAYYESLCNRHGFVFKEASFINIFTSYLYAGAIRKVLNPKSRKEGEPLNNVSIMLQKMGLPLTNIMDKVFPVKRDLAKMIFVKNKKP